MSKIAAALAIDGAAKVVNLAHKMLQEAIVQKGERQTLAFPETAYFLPLNYALLGKEIKNLKEAELTLQEIFRLMPSPPQPDNRQPYLGAALDAGLLTLLTGEIILALKYLDKSEPQPDCPGFFSDNILRSLGIQLVDGRMPGFALLLGAAPEANIARELVRELQIRGILTFVGGSSDDISIIDQLKSQEVELGWDTYIVPLGRDTLSAIYLLNWAIRAALTYGGLKKGEGAKCLKYCKERIPAFGIALGALDEFKVAAAFGAIAMGFPLIADTEAPEMRIPGLCPYEALVKETDYKKMVALGVQIRGIKVKKQEVPIPVLYGPAFEGERIRRENTYAEFGGNRSVAYEYLKSLDLEAIDQDTITLNGPDLDQMGEGKSYPLAIKVEVAGRKMQKDFEPVLERQFHTWLNEAMGVMHVGQRDIIWLRISKEAYQKGFRLKHLGVIILHRIHEVYGKVVNKVRITISTVEAEVQAGLAEARQAYRERDDRIAGMTDEEVDIFYSCTLCQSFAPKHVCIIKPERLGLCGAYTWLDGKAAYELDPLGGTKPMPKGTLLDAVKGEWEGVNAEVYKLSQHNIERVCGYSIMEYPETSCGCFECIIALLPEANGFMVVNREYTGMTPSGMTFSTLAGIVGGGNQTPGFMGVGKLYLTSRKFISADGGLKRLVWMPKELKEFLGERLKKRAAEEGMPDLVDKIADENVGTSVEEVLAYLEEVQHPALTMSSLL
jgi:acetyl-CoA synthase